MTEWPFAVSELTAALRRYLGESDLEVFEVREEPVEARPARGVIRGVGIDLERAGHREHYSYLLKEQRAPPAPDAEGAGLREVGLYGALAWQLPLAVPELVASDQAGTWLLLEPYPSEVRSEDWTADHYRQAVVGLAHLHDRFWDLDEDLSVYPWIARPLAGQFEAYLLAAARSMEAIVARGAPEPIASSVPRLTLLSRLFAQADLVARVLRRTPQTLLHGDYWPGNISIDEDGRHIVYDWQMVQLGPGVIDLIVLINKSRWWLAPLPLEPRELIDIYRAELATHTRHTWPDAEWESLWDHALMWYFLQEWFKALAAPGGAVAEADYDRLEKLWLEPVCTAIDKWLEPPQ